MQAVYDRFGNGEGSLVCTAKEVYANNANVTGGPTSCMRGDYIYVNVTASIHFNTARYDPAIYTASSDCIVGNTANNCAVDGSTCAVDVLTEKDATGTNGAIASADTKGGPDSCYDVTANGYDLNGFLFQNDLKIECDEYVRLRKFIELSFSVDPDPFVLHSLSA
jgi:hypothetical protein